MLFLGVQTSDNIIEMTELADIFCNARGNYSNNIRHPSRTNVKITDSSKPDNPYKSTPDSHNLCQRRCYTYNSPDRLILTSTTGEQCRFHLPLSVNEYTVPSLYTIVILAIDICLRCRRPVIEESRHEKNRLK